jgi:hydroxypyruvate reductase
MSAKVALLANIPPDIRTGVAAARDLRDAAALSALPEAERAAITQGLTSALGGLSAEVLDLLPGLRHVVSIGAGLDRFDLADLARRGITLRPTPELMAEDVAELVVALTFAGRRNVVANDAFVRRGDWLSGRPAPGRRVSGSRVGIVGLGWIGGRAATKLAAVGCEIAYTGRRPRDVGWRFESDLLALADWADVLVVSCPGDETTRGLIDARVLAALGPDGLLINVARGLVVDEDALIAALQTGGLGGAALDVFLTEPAINPAFAGLRNCILQPHAASFTRENRRDLLAGVLRLLAEAGSART